MSLLVRVTSSFRKMNHYEEYKYRNSNPNGWIENKGHVKGSKGCGGRRGFLQPGRRVRYRLSVIRDTLAMISNSIYIFFLGRLNLI